MPQFYLHYTDETDLLYTEDVLKSISPNVVFAEDREQRWDLPEGRYWLLRVRSTLDVHIECRVIEVTREKVYENPEVAFRDLPAPLQTIIQKRRSQASQNP